MHVGSTACAECHATEYDAWLGSHHQLAMLPATEETVLGDFDNATFTSFGVTSRFFRRDGRFVVETEGADGALAEYEVTHTFGWTPLQQYLVDFPGGRRQVLPLCWDTRPREEGGQRWFHIHPDERIAPHDVLFWTGIGSNWNHMCAECHSTDLRRNYDVETDSWRTTFEEVSVGCEACHGPGSVHVTRMRALANGEGLAGQNDDTLGLLVRLKEPLAPDEEGVLTEAFWDFAPDRPTLRRTRPLASSVQVDTCARCHSHRHVLSDSYAHGRPLLDHFEPSTLDRDLYHPDGQILAEVYVYGSFVQSRMHREGVRCTDCHDPHSTRLRLEGNTLCTSCHVADHFDTPSHHHHAEGSAGASCIECHMPHQVYMVVDPRRDHSFRVPRPDLSLELGTPNACTQCHTDRDNAWADEWCATWYGSSYRDRPTFARAIAAGRAHAPGSGAQLVSLLADQEQPGIARATALTLLTERPTPEAVEAAVTALADPDALVRVQAVRLLELLPPAQRATVLAPLLDDPVLDVRIQAAKALAALPSDTFDAATLLRRNAGIDDSIAAEMATAERASAHINLGLLYTDLGRFADAEAAYRRAMALEPWLVQPAVNLADLFRVAGDEAAAERVLRDAIVRHPDAAVLYRALGLSLVRQKRMDDALSALADAARLGGDDPANGYTYALALFDLGRRADALALLKETAERHPNELSLLGMLLELSIQVGDRETAIRSARRLLEFMPDASQLRSLISSLEAQRPHP